MLHLHSWKQFSSPPSLLFFPIAREHDNKEWPLKEDRHNSNQMDAAHQLPFRTGYTTMNAPIQPTREDSAVKENCHSLRSNRLLENIYRALINRSNNYSPFYFIW
mmetsp:Transcript_24085/g.50081  ORF Transcript_24085/g.50081 Transcript_24085/m.50081 type:complete len:105 (+) Transcript_24085:585-899(+)